VSFVQNGPGFSGNKALALVARNQCDIDLHWRLGSAPAPEFRPEAIIARRVRAELFGTPLYVVSAADGLLLSAHHSMRNVFCPAEIARDLVDSHSWLVLLERRGQLENVIQHALACGLAVQLLAMLLILVRYEMRGPALSALSMLEKRLNSEQNRSARALVDLFLLQLERGPLNRDLLDLFQLTHPASLRELVKELFWRAWRLRKHTGRPLRLKERLGAFCRSLTGIRRAQITLLRNFARVRW
jgi:hypothetical protein